ncbi:MAG: glycosyltransferase family 2 protein [Kiritimatiellae bacterium]|jgi:glycosyltransferase involved in cell wall biosynthesis|nr:glycosyltransferase family 2 protein [Kiritimatiellia bacterium]
MRITLITACYNSAAVIGTALESVLRQTWPDVEYWVIDGGSTDGTLEIIREYEPKFGGRMHWVSEPDRGMYDAINKGIRWATGEVVGILNADDVLVDDRVLERVASAFGVSTTANCANRANGDAKAQRAIEPLNPAAGHLNLGTLEPDRRPTDVVYGDIRFVADRRGVGLEELRAEPTVRYYSSRHWRPWMARFGYVPAHPSFYCRRELFEKFGGYQTDYKIAADHELLIRFLVKERVRSVCLPEVMVVMRLGGVSTRSVESTLILNRENICACRANGIYTNRLMQLGKYLVKIPGLIFKTGY